MDGYTSTAAGMVREESFLKNNELSIAREISERNGVSHRFHDVAFSAEEPSANALPLTWKADTYFSNDAKLSNSVAS